MKHQADDELQPGVILQQRYEIVRKIGAGGFGEVYLARRLKFRQRVAVKKLRAAVASTEMREQFDKEAALLFGLTHRSLPKVVDAFSQEDGEFLVMEYIEGRDLAEIIDERRGPVALGEALAWGDQILDSLEYLHTRRPPVIHRDIKPHNIKLGPDGRVVLLDFGLAKGASGLMWSTTLPGAGDRGSEEAKNGLLRPTSKSIGAGSIGYSPLEQLAQNPTDERSDLYSLAATLYTLLAYAIPEVSVVRGSKTAIGSPDPLVPIRALNLAVPEAVESVILKSLAIHREDRHASATEFRLALGYAAKQALQGDDHPGKHGLELAGRDVPTAVEIVTEPERSISDGNEIIDSTEEYPDPSHADRGPTGTVREIALPPAGVVTDARAEESKSMFATADWGQGPTDALPSDSFLRALRDGRGRGAGDLTAPVTLEPKAEVVTGRGPALGSIVAALALIGLLAIVGIGWWTFRATESANVQDETTVMQVPPEPEVPPAARSVEALRYRLERMDGTPIELSGGRLPKETEFRIKLWTPVDGRVFLVLKNSDGRSMVYVSDTPSVAGTGIASNGVRAGEEFVFPGRGRPFSVEQGSERLLLGFAKADVKVPAGLEGNPLEWLSTSDAAALDRSTAELTSEVRMNGDNGQIHVLVNEESLEGLVMFDVNELTQRVGGPR